MVGFRPTDSLVAVALCGPRERMSFSLRLDLPAPDDDPRVIGAVAGEVARRMTFAKADAVMLFVFASEPTAVGALPHRALIDAVEAGLDAPLREAALVGADRMWSYVCDEERCCPPEGRPIERQSAPALALAAEHAALGNVVLGSREELLRTITPIGGIAAESMRQAQDRAIEAMIDTGLVAFSAQVESELDDLAERFTDPRASVSDEDAARIAIALADKLLRDHILVRLSDPDDEGLHRLLSAVARKAQPPDDAPICTLVGYSAYIDGSGVIASAAFDRALQSDPDYVLAHYLGTMLQNQVAPDVVRECGTGCTTEVAKQRKSRRRRR